MTQISETKQTLTILGSTGSIGQSTLDIVRHHRDRYQVEALVANRNIEQLASDAKEFAASLAVTADPELYSKLCERLSGSGIACAAGAEAVAEAASRPVDMVMAAIVGADGLEPTLAAVRQGTTIALANKECLVSAGDYFMAEVARKEVTIVPVDSEHNAIFQCFEARNEENVAKVTLTASGGPFRTKTLEELQSVTLEEALNHPNWSMGPKITIDSATLMNKGLELIEAFHLFPVSVDQLDAVIHPQSIIHSYVTYVDGSVLAQLGVPDMRTPIACAMAYPQRIETPVSKLDLAEIGTLTFEEIDHSRFRTIGLCLNAMKVGGSATTILNAANEVAVAEFLSNKIHFTGITDLVERVIDGATSSGMIVPLNSLTDVRAADEFGRKKARELARSLQA